MTQRLNFFLCGSLAAMWLMVIHADAVSQTKMVQIGMAKSFLEDKPKAYIDLASDEFKEVLKKTTGLDGDLVSKFEAFEVAQKLQEKKLDFAVLHAHEFAWVQKKYADLEPLLAATSKGPAQRVYLIVSKKDGAKAVSNLKGKKLDFPTGTSSVGRVFLDQRIGSKDQKGAETFFASIAKSASPTEALDDLARGKVDAVVVDAMGLEFYKEVKGPVFAKNHTILEQSDVFPPPVIIYKKGGVDDATKKQFYDGLLKAHELPKGRDMMKSWNIDAFEAVPADYSKQLAAVLKAYPPAGSP